MESVEVVVIGGGIMGTATAWRLARRGHEVVLCEQFEIGHDRGSSHGPTRVFRFAYEDPLYVHLAQGALPLWHELEREAGQSLLDITGGLDIGPAGKLQPIARAVEACGAAFELMNHPPSRYPGVRTTHLGLLAGYWRHRGTSIVIDDDKTCPSARCHRPQQTAAHIEAIEDHHDGLY